MFTLLDKVFGIDPGKVGAEIVKETLADATGYSTVGEFFEDVGKDIKSTAEGWGKSLGLIEDTQADLDLMVEQARERMQPIRDKYSADRANIPNEPPTLEQFQSDIDGSRAPERPPV